MTDSEKAKELADKHWEYLGGVLMLISGHNKEQIATIQYHYKTAFIHGYKHGKSDKEPQ